MNALLEHEFTTLLWGNTAYLHSTDDHERHSDFHYITSSLDPRNLVAALHELCGFVLSIHALGRYILTCLRSEIQ